LIGAFIIDNRSGTYNKYTTSWFKSVGAYVVELDQGLVPTSIWNPSIFDLIIMSKNTFLNYGLTSLLSQVTSYVINRFQSYNLSKVNAKCSNIKVCSGEISKCYAGEFEIRSHAFDYDIYLQQKDQNSINKEDNYAVFLDSGIVAHPDSRRLGAKDMPKEIETENTYYPAINSFFDDFEKRTGMPVVIALHPRIIISEEFIRQYGGREVISKDTSRLVKNSKIVIVHNSTSMNFAVLWKIPLLIITTTIIDRIDYSTMKAIEKVFKTKRININRPYKDKDYIKISKDTLAQYQFYMENLIKTKNSQQVKSVKILIKGLKEYVQ
ncbi:hypothetical protein OAK13_06210, partial [Candidatus Thioglobus sp.]|nr:hypothetical protein [Candidatus Thioglobus sp.]